MKQGHELPINKTAALVTQKGVHYVSGKKIQTCESRNPIATKIISKIERENPEFVDVTGFVVGRLTVLGRALYGPNWVCRCTCGTYCVRKRKAILNPNNTQDRCEECRHLAFLKRDDYRRRTGKYTDINKY